MRRRVADERCAACDIEGSGVITHLGKSTILAAHQCARRLWLTCFAPELAGPPDSRGESIRDAARAVVVKARECFPGGILVDDEDFARAVSRTEALLRDPTVGALFDAAFVHDGIRIRVDVLERMRSGAWGIREAKSAARVKDAYLDDVAVQRYVLEGAGLTIESVEVLHLDTRYVRDGEIEWQRLFARTDVTVSVAERVPGVAAIVRGLQQQLNATAAPVVEPSAHCWTPYGCEFWTHCTRAKPVDWIYHLPQIRTARRDALEAAGIDRITDIPDDAEVGVIPTRIRDVLRSGRPFVSPDLAAALADFGPPAFYLDFETMNAAIPLYSGTRPFEQIPMQWSLHRLDADGGLTHRAFLADGGTDPRRDVAETLLAAVGDAAEPIIVYSDFESMVLAALALALPDLATALDSVRERLRDLWAIVRRHVYHPAFGYSFSLKSVVPALVPDFGWADLAEIADGYQASRAFDRLDDEPTRRALLAYCERDTRALVELHSALRGWSISGEPPRSGEQT